MTDEEAIGPRELWVQYKGKAEPELVVDGTTTDHSILEMFGNIFGRESDAWLLRYMGKLPIWWRLVENVQVRNLSDHKDLTQNPGDDAMTRWDSASIKERMALQRGWRIVRGRGGGNQIYRVPHHIDRDKSFTPVSVEGLEITPIEVPEKVLIIPEQALITL